MEKEKRGKVKAQAKAKRQSKVKVLLLSHEKQFLRMTSLILKKEGYWVQSVNEPEDAYSILTSEDVDILILDLEIPELDAYQFVRSLLDEKCKTMTIVISDRKKSKITEQYTRYFLYATFGIIYKPYRKEDLLHQCKQILSTKGL